MGLCAVAYTAAQEPLSLLSAVFILANIDRNILAILLKDVRTEFALADWQLGQLSGFAFSLLYGIGGLFVFWLADRGDRASGLPRLI